MCNEYLLTHFNVLKKQNFCVFVFVDGLLMLNECLFEVKKIIYTFAPPTLSLDSIPILAASTIIISLHISFVYLFIFLFSSFTLSFT